VRKPDPGRIAPLARLKVGTKLMLLVLLPVCVLLSFTGFTALADWHAASQLQDFRAATRLSFATAGVAGQLATERTAAAMVRLRPGAQAQAGLGAAQRDVNQALHHAQDSAAVAAEDTGTAHTSSDIVVVGSGQTRSVSTLLPANLDTLPPEWSK